MSVEAILNRHCVDAEVQLKVDAYAINDGQALEAVKLIEESKKTLAAPEATYVLVDQVVPANDPAVSSAQRGLVEFAKKQGTEFTYGSGMLAHKLLQGTVNCGDVVVAGDADVAMVGAVGALGLCLCPSKLAQALVEGKVEIPQPKVFQIKITQKLAAGTDIRDAAMKLVNEIQAYVKPETVIEFIDDNGVLSPAEKMILCGWMQKLGVLSALFVEEAGLACDYVLELGKVVPLINVGGTDSLASVPEEKVFVVYIGGAYGGTLEAIQQVAEAVAGKEVAYEVRMSIAPATSEIYQAAASAGYFTTIMEAGGMILNQCALPPVQARAGVDELLVSNDNHNEAGYAGKGSKAYLVSTFSAIQAALTGKIGGDK